MGIACIIVLLLVMISGHGGTDEVDLLSEGGSRYHKEGRYLGKGLRKVPKYQ